MTTSILLRILPFCCFQLCRYKLDHIYKQKNKRHIQQKHIVAKVIRIILGRAIVALRLSLHVSYFCCCCCSDDAMTEMSYRRDSLLRNTVPEELVVRHGGQNWNLRAQGSHHNHKQEVESALGKAYDFYNLKSTLLSASDKLPSTRSHILNLPSFTNLGPSLQITENLGDTFYSSHHSLFTHISLKINLTC